MEDMSVIERFLKEAGLDEGQKDEIVAIIKGMGELFIYLVIHAYVLHFCCLFLFDMHVSISL